MREELLKGLTEEQIAKVNECNSAEEILALAKEEGVQLSDEQLEAVSGGGCFGRKGCPECGSNNLKTTKRYVEKPDWQGGNTTYYDIKCKDCGYKWTY